MITPRVPNLTAFLSIACLSTLIPAHAATLNVRDFGALPDDGKDDTEAVAKAVEAAKPGDVLQFEAGTYYFDNPKVKAFQASGYSPLPEFPVKLSPGLLGYIDLTRREGLTLRGAVDIDEKPATVLMRHNPLKVGYSPPSQVMILHAKDVALENFHFTMDERYTVVWEIVEVAEDHFVGRVPQGYPLVDGMPGIRNGFRPSVSLSIDKSGDRTRFYGLTTKPWRTVDATKRLQRVDAPPKGLKAGDVVFSSFSSNDGAPNITAAFSDGVTVRNVWIDTGFFSAARYYAVKDATVDGVYVSPPGGLLIPHARDGFTFCPAMGKLRVNRHYMQGSGDDPQPSWSAGCIVRKIVDSRTVLYTTSHHTPVRVDSLPAPVHWLNPETGMPEFAGNCIKITPEVDAPPGDEPVWGGGNANSKSKVGTIVLDRDLPKGLQRYGRTSPTAAAILWFDDNSPDRVDYTNSVFEHTTGGIRFPFKKGSLVQNCVFEGLGFGIKSQLYWAGEDIPYVGHVNVEDSLFVDSGVDVGTEEPAGEEPVRVPDVNLRGNTFVKSQLALRAKSDRYGWCDSVIERNGFENPNAMFGFHHKPINPTLTVRDNFKATLLLHDGFVRHEFSKAYDTAWQPGAGAWTIDLDCHKFYKQTDESAAAKLSTAGDAGWKDYWVKVNTRRVADKGAIGVVGHCADERNYVLFEQDAASVRLVKVAGGKRTTLKQVEFKAAPGQWYNLCLRLNGGKLAGQVDGETLVEADDASPQSGKVGLYSSGGRSKFDDVIVVADGRPLR